MFNIDNCYDSFASEPNSAYFWSGLGQNGADKAAEIAQENGGTTLEMLMEQNKESIISAGFPYDEDMGGFYYTQDTASYWEAASQAYAEQASGEVHVILGENIRDESVWNTKEYPSLSESDNVSKIISVDPYTGKDKDILLNNTSFNSGESNNNTNGEYSSQHIESIGGGGARAPDDANTQNENSASNNLGDINVSADQFNPTDYIPQTEPSMMQAPNSGIDMA